MIRSEQQSDVSQNTQRCCIWQRETLRRRMSWGRGGTDTAAPSGPFISFIVRVITTSFFLIRQIRSNRWLDSFHFMTIDRAVTHAAAEQESPGDDTLRSGSARRQLDRRCRRKHRLLHQVYFDADSSSRVLALDFISVCLVSLSDSAAFHLNYFETNHRKFGAELRCELPPH